MEGPTLISVTQRNHCPCPSCVMMILKPTLYITASEGNTKVISSYNNVNSLNLKSAIIKMCVEAWDWESIKTSDINCWSIRPWGSSQKRPQPQLKSRKKEKRKISSKGGSILMTKWTMPFFRKNCPDRRLLMPRVSSTSPSPSGL